MKYKDIKSVLLVFLLVFFSACQSSDSESATDSDVDNVSTTNDDTILRAAVNIDNEVVKVHDNTFKTTSDYYTSTGRMLSDFTRMSQSVTDRMSAEMELLNKLAQPFGIASDYTSFFSVNNKYTATTPAFVINKALTNNYFLVSSESKFYLQGKTIKTFFRDPTSLAKAWSRAIINANKTKDLYLCLLEIDSNGKVTQVTNSFLIKSATLETY